tara:strand:+ start:3477 stop:4451 length:975 start_codon:yes stop_codon:yes gene_type:complete
MRFFDKKEEVLDIELTQYGKHLLSRGKFKPTYYAFFDNNVLYDPKYADTLYDQNEIDKVIRFDTPTLRSQHNFASLDSKHAYQAFQYNVDRHFTFVNPLGTSDLISASAPKWSLLAMEGELKSSVPYMTSSYQTIRIPQIEVDIEYQTAISVESQPTVFEEDPELASKTFTDGSYISVKPDQLLLRVLEENVEFEKDNFDIEVYLMEEETDLRIGDVTATAPITILKPLLFKEKFSPVQDGILVDDPLIENPAEPTPQNVEYYFDVFVDNEIEPDLLCQSIESLKKQDIYLDMDIECPDIQAQPGSVLPNAVIIDNTDEICEPE